MYKITFALLVAVFILQCLPRSESDSLNVNILRYEADFNEAVKNITIEELSSMIVLKDGIVAIKEHIENLPDKEMKVFFEEITNGIINSKENFKEINEIVLKKYLDAMTKIDEKSLIVVEIDEFLKKQMEILENKQEKEQGMKIIGDLVYKTAVKLSDCSKATKDWFRLSYEETQGVISHATNDIIPIIKNILDCMNQAAEAMKCRREISKDAESKLSYSKEQYENMKSKLNDLDNSIVDGSVLCMDEAVTEFNLNMIRISKEIANLK